MNDFKTVIDPDVKNFIVQPTAQKFVALIHVPQQRIVDMFIGACEGGSNYWAEEVDNADKSCDPYLGMLRGFKVVDREGSGGPIVVRPADIEMALGLMATNYVKHFSDLINETDDAVTADVFLQLCCFREVIYG